MVERRDRDNRDRDRDKEFTEKLIKLNRVAKVVKGGRRFSFSALVVVGDQKGRVGLGFGKANDVTEAIRKSIEKAKKNMINLPLKNGTLPHEVIGQFKSAEVLMKPAAPGTGVIAGGPVRAVMDVSGVTDILSKSLGSKNTINIVKAVFEGFNNILDAKEVARNRGKSLAEMWG
ncbi:30S ribosomal protein S5 [Marispirochaeta aestuarii]|uniref:Small ribosomal subunit protein uS5 n=1 Tax=Marispirochaeta aestuarii TaxID=1963862 RepID=A0A1Y1S2V3_9SPIO|nr:30S ribosomal protein S5 [Marispirochaeta aestuarii]ORC38223.1 30S ribosomal protein S5 [Marispirochaeta aestuarii]